MMGIELLLAPEGGHVRRSFNEQKLMDHRIEKK